MIEVPQDLLDNAVAGVLNDGDDLRWKAGIVLDLMIERAEEAGDDPAELPDLREIEGQLSEAVAEERLNRAEWDRLRGYYVATRGIRTGGW